MKLRKILLGLLLILLIILAGLYFYTLRHPEIFSEPVPNSFRESVSTSLQMLNPAFTKVTAGRQVQDDGISYAKVKEVVDGDTIKLESGETVRYIGVDSPEIWEYSDKENKWHKVDKCYSQEALEKNKELMEGKTVGLEKDISDKDKFGRLLRYVWVGSDSGQARMTGMELVKFGYATALTVLPDIKYEQQILAAEKEAKEKGRGLWSTCKFY